MKPILVRAGAAGLAAATFLAGGAAVAASQSADDRQAFLDDAAKRLGVDADRLEDALREAAVARVDAAVAAGRLTEEQANRIKERIRSGEGPIFGGPRHFGHGRPAAFLPAFRAAAEYLDLSREELREARREGKSLADLARERGKSVEGLERAMLQAAEARLDAAVEAGRLTAERRADILSELEARIGEIVQATGVHSRGFRPGWHPWRPPPGDRQAA